MSEKAEIYNQVQVSGKELIALLYNRYGKRLYGYALATWNLDEDRAWELIYKTLYKVIESYRGYTFESEEKFASFIFTIFINYLRNDHRDRKKAAEAVQVADVNDEILQNIPEQPKAEQNSNVKMAALREELEQMEDWQRMLLLMRSEGMAYSEIAKYVNRPEDQLKVYYQRLKQQITKRIHERL